VSRKIYGSKQDIKFKGLSGFFLIQHHVYYYVFFFLLQIRISLDKRLYMAFR